MGYDFHITRKEYWSDENGPRISLNEWLDYAGGDKDLEPDQDNPGPQNWLMVSHVGRWPLWWQETGEVYTKDPSPFMIQKMISIANALNAHVLGDDDEIYGADPLDAAGAERRL